MNEENINIATKEYVDYKFEKGTFAYLKGKLDYYSADHDTAFLLYDSAEGGEDLIQSEWGPVTKDNVEEWIAFLNSGVEGSLQDLAEAVLERGEEGDYITVTLKDETYIGSKGNSIRWMTMRRGSSHTMVIHRIL